MEQFFADFNTGPPTYCIHQLETLQDATKIQLDLIGPYTLKGKGGSSIDFMCLTMVDSATSWFEIVELPTVTKLMTVPTTYKSKKVTFAENTKVHQKLLLTRVLHKSVT